MSGAKSVRCPCGREIPLCERCMFRPVEHETTDGLSLCATCAEETHTSCVGCGQITPSIEVGTDGGCLDCSMKKARNAWANADTEPDRRRGEALLDAYGALVLLIWMRTERGITSIAGYKVEDALSGVRQLIEHA